MSGVTIAILAGSAAAAFVLGFILQRFLAARVRKGAMSEAERILADARRDADQAEFNTHAQGNLLIGPAPWRRHVATEPAPAWRMGACRLSATAPRTTSWVSMG